MKKTLLTTTLATGLALTAFASQGANAADGTITFAGAVTGTTCTISVNGGTGGSATVTLPTVQASDFTAANVATGFVPLTIALTACTAGATEVRPYFEPASTLDTTSGYTNYLKNTATTSAASGVDIMISTGTSGITGALTLSGSEGAQGVTAATITGGKATFNLYAAYVSNAATVNAGAVSSTLVYDLDYK
jgi:major type 1 subunit fimbrin (pilin)